jgi:tRNA(Arg) A34 adenosine deaminase TadA
MENSHEYWISLAVEESFAGMQQGHGGPFGAVIVKNGELISKGHNSVIKNNDPTAHAEVVAIREACEKLNTFQLTDCIVYTSCEPCPMCMGAIYWARPKAVYYANTKKDAAAIGFDDQFIYEELAVDLTSRKLPLIHTHHPDAIKAFEAWNAKLDKDVY